MLDSLARMYHETLIRRVRPRSANMHDAEDTVQDAYLKMLEDCLLPQSPYAFAHRVINNIAIDRVRSRTARQRILESLPPDTATLWQDRDGLQRHTDHSHFVTILFDVIRDAGRAGEIFAQWLNGTSPARLAATFAMSKRMIFKYIRAVRVTAEDRLRREGIAEYKQHHDAAIRDDA